MGINDAELNKMANLAAKKAEKILSPAQLFAISATAQNLRNGAFWGFVSEKEVRQYFKEIANDPNMVVRRIVNSCIIEVEPNYIIKSISQVEANIFSKADIQKMQYNMNSASIDFEKFLINKGITVPNFASNVAIYCTNSANSVACKGVSYAAFRLNLEKTLQLLGTYGYYIKVGGKFVTIQEAIQNPQATWNALQLVPAMSGVFIGIRAGLDPEQYKVYRKQLKQKYGA